MPKVNVFLVICTLLVCCLLVYVTADQEQTIAAQRAEILAQNDFANTQMMVIESYAEELTVPCEDRRPEAQPKELREQYYAKK